MSTPADVWVITTLAMYQTRFWAEVASKIKGNGRDVVFISFDDRSSDYLAARGFCVYSTTPDDKRYADKLMQDVNASLAKFGIENLNYWLTHERFAFELRDSRAMTRKLMTYLALADRCLTDLLAARQPIIFQELGGFISVIACYFMAQYRNIDHWFIEPSFYKGRQFFLKNRLSAIQIPNAPTKGIHEQVKSYLKQAQDHKTIVIPLKDKHHYSPVLRKIFNLYNIRRLVQKIIDKYIFKKHQEFGYLRSHVMRHIKMLFNSYSLKNNYTDLAELKSFIYYPLHVPGDMALTLRSPQFLDQLGLIDYLARNLPFGCMLAVKEHPAMLGAIDARSLKKLLSRYDNLALVNPSENNYDVISKCKTIVSVNSKSGAEGILLGRRVLVLGDAFYRNCPVVTPVDKITDIPNLLRNSLVHPQNNHSGEIENFFTNVWNHSYPGELYVCGNENTKLFANSMIEALKDA